MSRGERIAAAAERLAGTRFRLHGRDPATGLDCVGLVAAALADAGVPARPPAGYGLRNGDLGRWLGAAGASGLTAVTDAARRGDVLLFVPGPGQAHLAIACGRDRIAHAHAGIGEAMIGPIPQDWPIRGHWRALAAPQGEF